MIPSWRAERRTWELPQSVGKTSASPDRERPGHLPRHGEQDYPHIRGNGHIRVAFANNVEFLPHGIFQRELRSRSMTTCSCRLTALLVRSSRAGDATRSPQTYPHVDKSTPEVIDEFVDWVANPQGRPQAERYPEATCRLILTSHNIEEPSVPFVVFFSREELSPKTKFLSLITRKPKPVLFVRITYVVMSFSQDNLIRF